MKTYKIPRVVIAGTNSGVGKTTIVAGLLAAFTALGKKVQPFKVGPDYIDPGFHKLIPVSHARMAHSAMPGSRLEIFSRSGHFPFHDDPDRFVEVVERFIDDTVPAEYDQAVLRELLRHGVSERAVSGSLDTRVAVFDAIDTDERSAT